MFILAEGITLACLLINIKNSLLRLKKNYIIPESVCYIFFWICLIFAFSKKMQFVFALLPLLMRFFIKVKTYCKCDENIGENDLEIFFKVQS